MIIIYEASDTNKNTRGEHEYDIIKLSNGYYFVNLNKEYGIVGSTGPALYYMIIQALHIVYIKL